jgi:hypothetical protein
MFGSSPLSPRPTRGSRTPSVTEAESASCHELHELRLGKWRKIVIVRKGRIGPTAPCWLALAACLGLAACGGAPETGQGNRAQAGPDAPTTNQAELDADAALANEAAVAEAEDAALGGNVTAADVEAAGK